MLVAGPSQGTLTLNANGSFSYTPAANYNGSDSFTYRASDGLETSGVVTVALTIQAVNDPPGAVDDSYSTPANVPFASAGSVLANDGDIEGRSNGC